MISLFLHKILDWIFPSYCLGCGVEDVWICKNCFYTLQTTTTQTCPLCLTPSAWGETCLFCKRKNLSFSLDGVFAVYNYKEQPLLSTLIHNFKYCFIQELSESLGRLFANATKNFIFSLITHSSGLTVLCPIPLHSKRQQWRGFNQSELLSKYLSEYFKIPLISLLKRIHFSTPQQSLGREKRLTNVQNAFELIPSFSAQKIRRVLLVDDVATTLSTLQECARTLKSAGIKEVYGLVLARTPP